MKLYIRQITCARCVIIRMRDRGKFCVGIVLLCIIIWGEIDWGTTDMLSCIRALATRI